MKITHIIKESAYLNEFAAGDEGFGPFKVYLGDHLVDTFATFEEAEDEIEFIKDSDPRTRNELWKITDGTGETVWEHDPGAAIDAMRKAGKMQFLKPGSTAIKEEGTITDRNLSSIDPEDHDDMEGSFVKNQLHTMLRVLTHLENAIGDDEDLPEWVQMELSQAQEKIVGVMDYMISEKELDVEEQTGHDSLMREGETWAKHNNPRAGGMSKKSVSSYRRSHPGSKIQTAVTTKPSKLKKGSKAAARRKSFCARMKGMKKHRTGAKTARDPNSNINKSLRRWNCESVEQMQELVMLAEQLLAKHKK